MLIDRNSRGRTGGRTATLRGVLVAVGVAFGASAMAALAAEPPAPNPPAATSASQATPAPATTAQADANSAAADTPPFDPNNKWTFFEHYCEKCHNSTDWAGGVAFDTMSQDSIPDDAKELEEAVDRKSVV